MTRALRKSKLSPNVRIIALVAAALVLVGIVLSSQNKSNSLVLFEVYNESLTTSSPSTRQNKSPLPQPLPQNESYAEIPGLISTSNGKDYAYVFDMVLVPRQKALFFTALEHSIFTKNIQWDAVWTGDRSKFDPDTMTLTNPCQFATPRFPQLNKNGETEWKREADCQIFVAGPVDGNVDHKAANCRCYIANETWAKMVDFKGSYLTVQLSPLQPGDAWRPIHIALSTATRTASKLTQHGLMETGKGPTVSSSLISASSLGSNSSLQIANSKAIHRATAVCVGGLQGHTFLKLAREWVQYQILAGVAHVYLGFNMAHGSPEIIAYREKLQDFVDEGWVSIVSSLVPDLEWKNSDRGKMMHYQFCNYHSMESFSYVFNSDVDEMMMVGPACNATTIGECIEKLIKEAPDAQSIVLSSTPAVPSSAVLEASSDFQTVPWVNRTGASDSDPKLSTDVLLRLENSSSKFEDRFGFEMVGGERYGTFPYWKSIAVHPKCLYATIHRFGCESSQNPLNMAYNETSYLWPPREKMYVQHFISMFEPRSSFTSNRQKKRVYSFSRYRRLWSARVLDALARRENL